MQAATSSHDWVSHLRSLVDARLAAHFADKRGRTAALAPEGLELLDEVEALTMRGGKRLRPALAYAAHAAVGAAPSADVVEAGAALELLQTYLLIHDDWMDADEERRGGPSVHVALRGKDGRDAHLGASLAVLAGNLASAHAWELLTRIGGPERRLRAAIEVFLAIHQEVVVGQQLDLIASDRVALMQQLKTGSYTVRGPLALGAVLAGATDAQRRVLEAYGSPLGEAFQLRDDLLGTFGDRSALGKPTGNDLRAGKRTALIAAAEERASPSEREAIEAAFGDPAASDAAVARAKDALVASGARAAVESRAVTLLERAKAALEGTPLHAKGVAMLRDLADRLAIRDQ